MKATGYGSGVKKEKTLPKKPDDLPTMVENWLNTITGTEKVEEVKEKEVEKEECQFTEIEQQAELEQF